MKWQPATVEEVRQIVEQDLLNCDAEQTVAFKINAIEPYHGRIVRYGQPGTVVVVAQMDKRSSTGKMLKRASTYHQ